MNEWSEGLTGITGDQIKFGLESWKNDWPPSMDEFRDCCTGLKSGLNEYGMACVPEYYRTPEQITDPSRLLSSGELEKKKEKRAVGMKKMRETLGGRYTEKDE